MKNIIALVICVLCLAAGIMAQSSKFRVDIAKKIADATPPALPQSPKEARSGSDALDAGLKGKVKKVTYHHESADQGYPRQMLVREEFYGEDGNFVRTVEWDNVWPHRVTVFGYIDGMRVSRSKVIDYADGVKVALQGCVPLTMEKPTDDRLPKDTRYDNRSIFRYEASGRLIEEQFLANTGKLLTRTTYTYETKNTRLRLHFDASGREWYRAVEIFDPATESLVQEWLYDERKQVSSIHYHTYKHDEQGNWTLQKTRRQLTHDKPGPKWVYTTHRTIEYYR